MGGSQSVRDDRVQRCAEVLEMTQADINVFYDKFRTKDIDGKGHISVPHFFEIIGEPSSVLGQAIFELIDTDDSDKIEFGEFVQAIVTYCLFETVEVLKLCFFIYDRDKNGYVEQDQLQFFISALHGGKIAGNTQLALMRVPFQRDGKFDFKEMRDMNKQYPAVLFPAFRMQNSMMNAIHGERWWLKKKGMLAFKVEEERTRDLRRRTKTMREREKKRLKRKKQTIGTYAYYFKASVRDKYDERNPPTTMEDVIAEEMLAEEEARKAADEKILQMAKKAGKNPSGGDGMSPVSSPKNGDRPASPQSPTSVAALDSPVPKPSS